MTRQAVGWFMVLLPAFAVHVSALTVTWQPERPGPADRIVVRLSPASQGAVLHWGVNAKAHAWQSALAAYRPDGSTADGVATRSRFAGPDSNGVCDIVLGPFNHPGQPVFSVDFVIQWEDGSWDNNDGHDYHIPVHNQRIQFAPALPTLNDRIQVTVAPSRPGGQVRWGVNAQHGTWRMPAEVYRPAGSVPSDDGMAVDSPLPPPDAEGRSILILGPFHRAEQVVTSLHAAVHWGDDWESDFGRNYNLILQPSPQTDATRLVTEYPPSDAVFDQPFTATWRAPGADKLHIWMDGQPFATLTQQLFTAQIAFTNKAFGRHTLTARSGDDTQAQVTSVDFWHIPIFQHQTARPAKPLGLMVENQRAHFALFAPGKQFVSVVGDFNGNDPSATPMNCSTDGVWWAEVDVPEGMHAYQYLIDGTLRVADPYSADVEWKDEKGEETYRPECAKTIFHAPADEFPWTDQDFRRPPAGQTIIYELSIDDFTAGAGFTGLLARLDYLHDLGVNALEPLPFMEFAGRWSWGYNPSFHFAPETSHGTPEQLKMLIDEAHRRGMAVILDTVLNHMDWNSALHQLYGNDYSGSPYFWLFEGDNWGFPDLEQENPAFKRYVADLTAFWITHYHIDGFRYDATRWTGWQGYNDWGASWFAYAAKQADPHSLQIAEHLPTDPDLMNGTDMDAGWHGEFRWSLKDMLRTARLDPEAIRRLLDPTRIGFSNSLQVVVYTESHDEERIMKECLDAGFTQKEATRRAETALALTLTAPGIPMLYAGQEFGEATPKVVGYNPLHWENLNNPLFQRLRDITRNLIALRKTNDSLQGDARHLLLNDAATGCVLYSTTNAPRVLVAVNFSRQPRILELPGIDNTMWQDVQNQVPSSTNAPSITLEPGQSRVWLETQP